MGKFEGISKPKNEKNLNYFLFERSIPSFSKFVYHQELVYNKNIINIIEGKRNVS